MNNIILASSSKRRMSLLAEAGVGYRVQPADILETAAPGESPDVMVCRLAREKSLVVAAQYPDEIVLGADTIVYIDQEVIGKPRDLEHARATLERLSGRAHEVYTGVSLVRNRSRQSAVWFSVTKVHFKTLRAHEIDICLAGGDPLDRAGAYGIQDHEEILIDRYDGLRSNVMGLPIEEVIVRLREFSHHRTIPAY